MNEATELPIEVDIYDDGVFIDLENWKKLQLNINELKREIAELREHLE